MINFTTALLPYQREAVEKLRRVKVAALYMEQGTGKTRTMLELIKIREDAGKTNAVLWLSPCSVKANLRENIIYHCGEIPRNLIIRGIESLSSSDRLYLQLLELVEKYRTYLVVDESNLVKNPNAVRTERITALSEKCQYKAILNGTPVSRNEADLFAQWYILDWRILGYKSYYSFAANHIEYKQIKDANGQRVVTDQIAKVLNVDYLSEKIEPYTFQIRKSECLSLPQKRYIKHSFDLTAEQLEAYIIIKEIYLLAVDELKSDTIYKLFTALQHITSGRQVLTPPEKTMTTKPLFADWHDNPRMIALQNVIDEYIRGEKCIIFAKYQAEIDAISELLTEAGLSWALFTGKVRQKMRQENRAKFEGGAQFLLANKNCGAYGLNLQFCHNIIYYNNDFDLATRMQSEDRVHRLGQTQNVNIHDIYAPHTIDEFILDNLGRKEWLLEDFKRVIAKWKKDLQNEKGLYKH